MNCDRSMVKIALSIPIDRFSSLGDIRGDLRRVTLVLHKHSVKPPIGSALAKVKYKSGFELGESARPREIGDEIGVNERRQVLDCAETPR